jgi:hypothetical protein
MEAESGLTRRSMVAFESFNHVSFQWQSLIATISGVFRGALCDGPPPFALTGFFYGEFFAV